MAKKTVVVYKTIQYSIKLYTDSEYEITDEVREMFAKMTIEDIIQYCHKNNIESQIETFFQSRVDNYHL